VKVITLNCNGIRSAARKGFYEWMRAQDADIVCLQETKAQEHQLPLEAAAVSHYTAVFLDAERRGYSGVAIYARREPDSVIRGLGWPDFDPDARYLQLNFGNLSVVSLYVPSRERRSCAPGRQRNLSRTFLWRARTFKEYGALVHHRRRFQCGAP